MEDINAKILINDSLGAGFYKMVIKTGWKSFVPGQFVMIKARDAFLRRPFGIARLKEGNLEICYKVVGKGTISLSKVQPGEEIRLLGPIGKGFAIDTSGTAVLVAGGYGIVPMIGILTSSHLVGERGEKGVHLFYGAKQRNRLLYLEELNGLIIDLHISTEDGSYGEKGLITDAIGKFLNAGGLARDKRPVTIYACGPHAMLREVRAIYLKNKGPITNCQLSLEAYMGCGIGVCLGCVVKNVDGEYVRVCRDGPVFSGDEIGAL